ncbi:tRNA (5-methylaminomethyl-2-thiouridine)(34)-methyltransferase MnmD [Kordiimonas pumila]|uniref:tRNA 5-methylaminomethyl-2-thiouridine biosynthesis bifunctional protein MnmC n=1 Tax=Kordiimonas pumila TaxID=2161677 RepID=A0ABV7D1F5_9PROT|nr:tRNA (5-methylaminomethyl-2-thiouridine)(34)-methyltransferase MnmD [Kordiimonas pumila]
MPAKTTIRKIEKSELTWRDNAPIAPVYGDVYYSTENGLEESEFVFIKGTGAPEIWHGQNHYVIAETGFGTGLNFLCTYKAWLETNQQGCLTFISTEGFPLSEEALEQAHATFPELGMYAEKLRAAWPPPSIGFHSRSFENGRIKLLLLFGQAADTLPTLHARVDAWYLDGFSPAKNPDMWSDCILDQIARLSKPGARFATFTAAGFVKRGLRERGFTVQKAPGYGRKRERLVGTLTTPQNIDKAAKSHVPMWAAFPAPAKGNSVIIVGAGIAGASLANQLKLAGKSVTVLAGTTPGASSVPVAILAPSLERDNTPVTLFARSAFAHACSFPAYDTAWLGTKGLTLRDENIPATNKMVKAASFLDWPENWLHLVEQQAVLPKAGSIYPEKAINTLLTGITTLPEAVSSFEKSSDGWRIETTKKTLYADILVVAAGPATEQLLTGGENLHFNLRGGQCEIYDANTAGLAKKNIAFGGYVTAPSRYQNKDVQTVGSTFEKTPNGVLSIPPTKKSRRKIEQNTALHLGVEPSDDSHIESWTGVRVSSLDHRPMVGAVPDWLSTQKQFAPMMKDARIRGLDPIVYQEGLYVMTGFASKGFQQAPLAAEILSAIICGRPLPVALETYTALHPARHLIKKIIRKNRVREPHKTTN